LLICQTDSVGHHGKRVATKSNIRKNVTRQESVFHEFAYYSLVEGRSAAMMNRGQIANGRITAQ
jgi:hypothetical protein